MTTRSTTWVESDQLAQAAVHIIRNEGLVPTGKRWPFSRTSRAHREYDKAVQEITTRRREARHNAVEEKIKRERSNADAVLERATLEAQAAHDAKIAEARKPFNETESVARAVRDAAIEKANQEYARAIEQANRTFQQEAASLAQVRNVAVNEARASHNELYAALEEKRKAELAQIAKELRTIPLEGPMRVVEDREAWSVGERKKALVGLIDMAGREDFDAEYTDLCLRNVMGYVFQDRYLKPEHQHHRLMDANLLEALVDLARRTPEKRPIVVRYMHEIVTQNFGHSSPSFIKSLTELYVIASADTKTMYATDPEENERVVETMREHIADTLKLTPRRSQVPPAPTVSVSTRGAAAAADAGEDQKTPLMNRRSEQDITADVDVDDLVQIEGPEASEKSGPPPVRRSVVERP